MITEQTKLIITPILQGIKNMIVSASQAYADIILISISFVLGWFLFNYLGKTWTKGNKITVRIIMAILVYLLFILI